MNGYNKKVVITGSSKGIGEKIAMAMAEQGLDIVLHYFMDEKLAENVKSEIERKYNVKVYLVQANLNDPEEIKNMFKAIKQMIGNIDIFVNNAASGVHKKLEDMRLKDWDWTLNVNGRGAFLCTKEAAKLMDKDKPTYIINITSMGSRRVLPEYGAVGCSKAVLESLGRYAAVEYAGDNIIVNTIAGGVVETEALDAFPHGKDIVSIGKEKTPAGKLIVPEDIANLAVLLTSGKADMVRGQTIVVDGGFSLF